MNISVESFTKDDSLKIREKSVDVKLPLSNEDSKLLMDMFKYVKDSKDEQLAKKYNLRAAVGLAAVQIGVNKKLLAIDFDVDYDEFDNPISVSYALANAKIVSASAKKTYLAGGEACLSVDIAHQGYIYRSHRIKVKAFDLLTNKDVLIKASGYEAIVLQHEIDHFNGVLFYDHINKINPFQEVSDAIKID